MVTECREDSSILMEMGKCSCFARYLHWPWQGCPLSAWPRLLALNSQFPSVTLTKVYSTLCTGWGYKHAQSRASSLVWDVLPLYVACSIQCWFQALCESVSSTSCKWKAACKPSLFWIFPSDFVFLKGLLLSFKSYLEVESLFPVLFLEFKDFFSFLFLPEMNFFYVILPPFQRNGICKYSKERNHITEGKKKRGGGICHQHCSEDESSLDGFSKVKSMTHDDPMWVLCSFGIHHCRKDMEYPNWPNPSQMLMW